MLQKGGGEKRPCGAGKRATREGGQHDPSAHTGGPGTVLRVFVVPPSSSVRKGSVVWWRGSGSARGVAGGGAQPAAAMSLVAYSGRGVRHRPGGRGQESGKHVPAGAMPVREGGEECKRVYLSQAMPCPG